MLLFISGAPARGVIQKLLRQDKDKKLKLALTVAEVAQDGDVIMELDVCDAEKYKQQYPDAIFVAITSGSENYPRYLFKFWVEEDEDMFGEIENIIELERVRGGASARYFTRTGSLVPARVQTL